MDMVIRNYCDTLLWHYCGRLVSGRLTEEEFFLNDTYGYLQRAESTILQSLGVPLGFGKKKGIRLFGQGIGENLLLCFCQRFQFDKHLLYSSFRT